MKKFITTSIWFCMPLVLWALVVLLVDPFNYFGVARFIDDGIKLRNAGRVNSLLYQSIDYMRAPSEYMLIGDSRTRGLPLDEIKAVSGITYKSLCTNAAKLNEIIDLIYMAHSKKKLKHVVVGINFNMFNVFGYADRVENVRKILKNPLKYIYNKNVAQACYYVVRAYLGGKSVNSTPPMTREEFWKWNIEKKAVHWYGKYEYPENLARELVDLDNFAATNGIKLTFIIVPHQREFHDRLLDFGLAEEEAGFKTFMARLKADVVDYDFENEITTDKDNFNDPVHYNEKIGRLIVDEVWTDNLRVGRKL